MSGQVFDRTAWIRQVVGVDREHLTAAQKVVLIALSTFADYRDGTNARPGIDLLARLCNLTSTAVRNALTRGRDAGLIERTGAANGRGGESDVYRLVFSATAVAVKTVNQRNARCGDSRNHCNGDDDFSATATTLLAQRPLRPPVQDQHKTKEEETRLGTSPVPGPDAPTPSHSAKSKPAKLTPTLPGNDPPEEDPGPFGDAAPAAAGPPLTNAELARAAELPDVHPDDRPQFAEPEPSKYCPEHPDDTDQACPACRRARMSFEQNHADWQARWQADADAAAVNRKAWRTACQECDEYGWQLAHDGTLIDPARRCPHLREQAAHAAHAAKYTTPNSGKAAAS